jgi:transcriptional regulator with XRE-family HTH domain
VDLLKDPEELGKRLRAARGYAGWSRPEMAAEMGISESTVRRREEGDVGALGGKPAKRQTTVDAVLEVTGAPRILFEVKAPAPEKGSTTERRLAEVERQLGEMMALLGDQTQEELEADEESEAQRYGATGASSSEQEPGVSNG